MKTIQCCVALSPNHKGALILVRNSSLELLGPGSAIVWADEKSGDGGVPVCGNCQKSDPSLIRVLVIGDVKLEVLDTLAQQKKALWRRVTWLNWLSRLRETTCPIQRIESLIQHLNIFFGREVCQSLPSDLLSSLLGCEEIELLWVRDRYFQDWSWDMNARCSTASWFYLSVEQWQEILVTAFGEKKTSNISLNYCPLEVAASVPKSSQWSDTFSKINPFEFTESYSSSLWDSAFRFKPV